MSRSKTRGGKFLVFLVNLFCVRLEHRKVLGVECLFVGTQEVRNECICMALVISSDDKTTA